MFMRPPHAYVSSLRVLLKGGLRRCPRKPPISPSSSLCKSAHQVSFRICHSCLSAPPCMLAPLPIAFAHSPRFIVLFQFSPPRHRSCHFFDSDTLPHDGHTHHEAFPFLLNPGRCDLNFDTTSLPFTALYSVCLRYTRIPFVPLF